MMPYEFTFMMSCEKSGSVDSGLANDVEVLLLSSSNDDVELLLLSSNAIAFSSASLENLRIRILYSGLLLNSLNLPMVTQNSQQYYTYTCTISKGHI